MKKLFFILSLTTINCTYGFSQNTILKSEYVRKGVKGDTVYYHNHLFTGIAVKKAINGQIIIEEHYENGLANGLWKEWYPSGKKKFEGGFNHGKNDGLWTQWYEDGSIQRKMLFKSDGSVITIQ